MYRRGEVWQRLSRTFFFLFEGNSRRFNWEFGPAIVEIWHMYYRVSSTKIDGINEVRKVTEQELIRRHAILRF